MDVLHECLSAGPLLVLGGPGTGKTTLLVQSAANQIAVDKDSVVVLAQTRSAASKLRSKILDELRHAQLRPQVLTPFSWGFSLLNQLVKDDNLVTGQILTGPMQQAIITDLLSSPEAKFDWPKSIAESVGTQVFTRQLQRLVAKSRQLGLDPEMLAEIGVEHNKPGWITAGKFMDEYLGVIDNMSALDYSEIIFRTRLLLTDDLVAEEISSRIKMVFVDEYEECDHGTIDLLARLSALGVTVNCFADPSQRIFKFRGADVTGVSDFTRIFSTNLHQAKTILLTRNMRSVPEIASFTKQITSQIDPRLTFPEKGLAGRPVELDTQTPNSADIRQGQVYCYTSPTEAEMIRSMAGELMRLHHEQSYPWQSMAILSKTSGAQVRSLAATLSELGVPVIEFGGTLGLAQRAGVRTLLIWLEAATKINSAADLSTITKTIGQAKLGELLVSPLVAMSSIDWFRLAEIIESSGEDWLASFEVGENEPTAKSKKPLNWSEKIAQKLAQLNRVFTRILEAFDEEKTPVEVLWELWDSSSWPNQLRKTALSTDDFSDQANRCLDSICELFEWAERNQHFTGRQGMIGFLANLEGQKIAADTTRQLAKETEAVTITTVHLAKGNEWDVVMVPGLNEGTWPAIRLESGLFEEELLSIDRLGEPTTGSEVLLDEKRLFNVACSRAKDKLFLWSADSVDSVEREPSRFISTITTDYPSYSNTNSMTAVGLVAELRKTLCDPESSVELRDGAAKILANLAGSKDEAGKQLIKHADPASWWAVPRFEAPIEDSQTQPDEETKTKNSDNKNRNVSTPAPLCNKAGTASFGFRTSQDKAVEKQDYPIQDPIDSPTSSDKEVIIFSPSGLEALLSCPRRWFLERKAGGQTGSSTAANFGNLIHEVADEVARYKITQNEAEVRFATQFAQLNIEPEWFEKSELAAGIECIDRFFHWNRQAEDSGRQLLATEYQVDSTVKLETETGQRHVKIRGKIDRVESDRFGKIILIDFKTGKNPPTKSAAEINDQLGCYQLVLTGGGLDHITEGRRECNRAELVYLRAPGSTKQPEMPKVLTQKSLIDQPFPPQSEHIEGIYPQENWVKERLATAVKIIDSKNFPAMLSRQCSSCAFRLDCPAHLAGDIDE